MKFPTGGIARKHQILMLNRFDSCADGIVRMKKDIRDIYISQRFITLPKVFEESVFIFRR